MITPITTLQIVCECLVLLTSKEHIEVISKNKNISMFEDTGGTVGYTIDALQSCDGRSKRRRDSVKVEEANSVLFRYNRTY